MLRNLISQDKNIYTFIFVITKYFDMFMKIYVTYVQFGIKKRLFQPLSEHGQPCVDSDLFQQG